MDSPIAPRTGPDVASSRSSGGDPSSSLFAGVSTDTRIQLSWQDGSKTETGWEIQRSTTGPSGSFSVLVTLDRNAVLHNDEGLTPLTQYCYKVRPLKKTGSRTTYDPFYNTSCATTYGPPAAPSNLVAVPNWDRIALTWTDNATTENGFRIERGPAETGPWTVISSPFANAGTSGAYTDGQRPLDQLACYRIVAHNFWGQSPSNVDCTAPPATPTALEARGATSNIQLTWRDNSSLEDGYEIQRALDSEWQFTVIATLPADATSYTDGAVALDVRYRYQVRATKDGGPTFWSSSSAAFVPSGPPATPEIIAMPWSSNGTSVHWGYVERAQQVRVERSADGVSGWAVAATVSASTGGFSDFSATEVRICFRVVALNDLGEAPVSNVACTIPPAAPTDLVERILEDGNTEASWRDNSQAEDGFYVWLRGPWFCDDWGYCYEPEFYDVLGPNSTSYILAPGYVFLGVAATRDNGYSDWLYSDVVWGSSALSASQAKLTAPSLKDMKRVPIKDRISRPKK